MWRWHQPNTQPERPERETTRDSNTHHDIGTADAAKPMGRDRAVKHKKPVNGKTQWRRWRLPSLNMWGWLLLVVVVAAATAVGVMAQKSMAMQAAESRAEALNAELAMVESVINAALSAAKYGTTTESQSDPAVASDPWTANPDAGGETLRAYPGAAISAAAQIRCGTRVAMKIPSLRYYRHNLARTRKDADTKAKSSGHRRHRHPGTTVTTEGGTNKSSTVPKVSEDASNSTGPKKGAADRHRTPLTPVPEPIHLPGISQDAATKIANYSAQPIWNTVKGEVKTAPLRNFGDPALAVYSQKVASDLALPASLESAGAVISSLDAYGHTARGLAKDDTFYAWFAAGVGGLVAVIIVMLSIYFDPPSPTTPHKLPQAGRAAAIVSLIDKQIAALEDQFADHADHEHLRTSIRSCKQIFRTLGRHIPVEWRELLRIEKASKNNYIRDEVANYYKSVIGLLRTVNGHLAPGTPLAQKLGGEISSPAQPAAIVGAGAGDYDVVISSKRLQEYQALATKFANLDASFARLWADLEQFFGETKDPYGRPNPPAMTIKVRKLFVAKAGSDGPQAVPYDGGSQRTAKTNQQTLPLPLAGDGRTTDNNRTFDAPLVSDGNLAIMALQKMKFTPEQYPGDLRLFAGALADIGRHANRDGRTIDIEWFRESLGTLEKFLYQPAPAPGRLKNTGLTLASLGELFSEIALVQLELSDRLDGFGLKVIDPDPNALFDKDEHDAPEQFFVWVSDPNDKDRIDSVIRIGFKFGNEVLRPATVRKNVLTGSARKPDVSALTQAVEQLAVTNNDIRSQANAGGSMAGNQPGVSSKTPENKSGGPNDRHGMNIAGKDSGNPRESVPPQDTGGTSPDAEAKTSGDPPSGGAKPATSRQRELLNEMLNNEKPGASS